MAKITYEFDMYEDQDDIKLFHSANKMYLALDEIYNIVRSELKYSDVELDEHTVQLLERIQEETILIHEMDS